MSNEMSKEIGMKIGIQGNLFQIAQALRRARVQAQQNVCFRGVSTDSRQIQSGQLFVALRGEKFDGHAYVADVLARGAVAVIIDEQGAADLQAQGLHIQPALIVPDTKNALGELARAWRSQFALPVIGVTGSNGKTTVKEMLASILAAEFGEAQRLATQGNLNNEIGVPLTLFRLHAQQRAAVIELGMNHPGEIAWLAEIAQPTVALVNNAQREHQEFMATVEAVARENGAVLSQLGAQGVAVFPAADEFTLLWQRLAGAAKCRTFALMEDGARCQVKPDVLGNTHATPQGQTLRCNFAGHSLSIELQVSGVHNARNALAALTAAWAAGCSPAAIQFGLENFQAVKGRLQRHVIRTGERESLLIDDTYNANPDSVRAAIDVLASLPAPQVLVLGDMGEVGDQGPAFHAEVGAYAKQQGISQLLCLGEQSMAAVEAFGGSGSGAQHFADIDTLIAATQSLRANVASMLVKGSRFMRMERVVAAYLAADALAPTDSEKKEMPHAA